MNLYPMMRTLSSIDIISRCCVTTNLNIYLYTVFIYVYILLSLFKLSVNTYWINTFYFVFQNYFYLHGRSIKKVNFSIYPDGC